MNDLNDLYYFVRVVDHGGFTAAARATNLQKSKLSRRVQQLEDRLGVRLVNRSTRQFSVTEIGLEYYKRCVAMIAEAEAADRIAADVHAAPRGHIRLSCPAAVIQYGLGQVLARFMALHPDVRITLDTASSPIDIIAGGFDMAIQCRSVPFETTDLVVRKIDTISLGLVAAPGLLAGAAVRSPGDLVVLPSIALGLPQRDVHWRLEHASGETAVVNVVPRFLADDMGALRDAALAGVGAVQLPATMLQEDLNAGRLVHVLSDWRPQDVFVYAVFPSRKGMAPAVRALLDLMVLEAANARRAAPPSRPCSQGSSTGVVSPGLARGHLAGLEPGQADGRNPGRRAHAEGRPGGSSGHQPA